MTKNTGEIIIKPDVDVWKHEIRTAQALAAAGYTVFFLKRRERDYERTPDVMIDGEVWEMKSPVSGNLAKVRKILRKALSQSNNIIYDSQRVKGTPDLNIERELRKQANDIRSIRRLLFVNKKREIIDIK